MLINNTITDTPHIKFISYTGKYPTLCMGVLTLEIDGVQHTFGDSFLMPLPEFKRFWDSGGSISADKDWNFHVYTDEWHIDVKRIPEQFQKYAAEIDVVFNENVEYGCCGGCI